MYRGNIIDDRNLEILKIENEMKKQYVVEDFYKMDLFNEDILKMVNDENCETNLNLLFLIRVYWKMMEDLDDGNGYDTKGWKFDDYNKFLDRLDEVDLNSIEYRQYFKEMVNYLISDIKRKDVDFIKVIEKNKDELEKKNNIEV